MLIRNALPTDFPCITALNLEFERFLSPMDTQRLALLHSLAAYHRVIESQGKVVAFLMAFREQSSYDSSNYHWFSQRYDRLMYIDRVVIAADQQGQRLGQRLYTDLFEYSAASVVPFIACEFDSDPPNLASERFHAKMGFVSVGKHQTTSGKLVSMQLKTQTSFAAC